MVAEIESKLSKLIKSIDFDNLCFKNNVFKVKKSNIPKLDIINLDYSEDYEEDNLYNLNISKYLEEVKVFYTPSILNSFNEANLKDDFIVFDEKLNWIYFNSNEKKFSQIDAVIEFDLFVKNLYYYYLLFDSIKSKNFCDHFDDANNQTRVQKTNATL
ncbi:hypothetical protein [Empedobacter sp. UBA5987]|uniref:hypothetical protein n=1 Tax=Empedobacter sp. UBA5987 TaxID=1946444 RepID=UPI0025C2F707|nr:hypothetical protein [Empedobacter sp. UBA5987]